MKRNQKGIVILPTLIIIVLLGIIGLLVYQNYFPQQFPQAQPKPSADPNTNWDYAKSLIENCRVTEVVQAHSREVYLKLKNGSTVNTIEPNLDDIFEIVRNSSQKCGEGVVIGTE